MRVAGLPLSSGKPFQTSPCSPRGWLDEGLVPSSAIVGQRTSRSLSDPGSCPAISLWQQQGTRTTVGKGSARKFPSARPLAPAVCGPRHLHLVSYVKTPAAEGIRGVCFHITWLHPSRSLKAKAQRNNLDSAKVSQPARVMCICATSGPPSLSCF